MHSKVVVIDLFIDYRIFIQLRLIIILTFKKKLNIFPNEEKSFFFTIGKLVYDRIIEISRIERKSKTKYREN